MQAVAPSNVHEAVYDETYMAGTHYKFPDHLSEMKTLQDAYRGFFCFQTLGLDQDLEQGLENVHHGAIWTKQP